MSNNPGPRFGPPFSGHPDLPLTPSLVDTGRRRFVQGLAAAGLVAAGPGPRVAGAAGSSATESGPGAPAGSTVGSPTGSRVPELRGPSVDLTIGSAPVNITGKPRPAVLVNGSLPAPTLRLVEGDTLTVRVRNTLREPTSIHWHGLLVPPEMDGVPGLSFPGIGPGESFTYRIPLRQSGTYWYHSHSGLQEQQGLYGGLVIAPANAMAVPAAERVAPDHDHVIVLSDWTDADPARLISTLKKQSDYYNYGQRTLGTLLRDLRRDGVAPTARERGTWAAMRMNASDLADVSGATYTFLMNGLPPAANWTAAFRPGEPVRLRFINAAAMTFFDVRIPGLPMTVVAADGQPVEPVTVDEFRMGNAETYDVIVTPGAGAWTLFAQAMDRSGYARGTLTSVPGLAAAVPALDRREALAMDDMGMGHGGHGGMDHGAMDHGANDHGAMDHGAMDPGPSPPAAGAAADHAGMNHGAMDKGPGAASAPPPVGPRDLSPTVDMRATVPVRRLADPGVGLRDNGRRVLTYAQLRSRFADPDGRPPARTVELRLTGHMERYRWSFDGVPASRAAPIRLKQGERLRFLLINDSMMAHPIHLHGLWSDLEDANGDFLVRKHTLVVKPGELLTYRVTADALGRWAYHCHLLLHMELGMFREVVVDA